MKMVGLIITYENVVDIEVVPLILCLSLKRNYAENIFKIE